MLEHHVRISVAPDGSVVEKESVAIRMDEAADIDRHGVWVVGLDDNRELVDVDGRIVGPDGKERRVGRRQRDAVEVARDGVLHDSRLFVVMEPDRLVPGDVFHASSEVVERPHFPSGAWSVPDTRDTVESFRLEIEIAPTLGPLHLDASGLPERLVVEHTSPDRAVITGSWDEGALRFRSPVARPLAGTVTWTWGAEPSWSRVEDWYADLIDGVSTGSSEVAELARSILADAGLEGSPQSPEARRAVLEALVEWIRSEVRYVAVAVGAGGYVPFRPLEVLDRRWGDCKDKSLLLIDLLASQGLAADPALVRLDADRPSRDFPVPDDFNHLIVAVSAEGLATTPEDPFDGERLWIDPTQTWGGVVALHRPLHGQPALLIGAGRGALSPVPVRPVHAERLLDVHIDLSDPIGPRGDLRLTWIGEPAAGWVFAPPVPGTPSEDALRSALAGAFPGLEIADLAWTPDADAPLPSFVVTATFRVLERTMVRETERGWSLRPPMLTLFPEVRDLDSLDPERDPGTLQPSRARSTITVRLPEGATATPDEDRAENGYGAYVSRRSVDGRTLILERTSRIDVRWFEPEARDSIRELALAENRDGRRSVRLQRP